MQILSKRLLFHHKSKCQGIDNLLSKELLFSPLPTKQMDQHTLKKTISSVFQQIFSMQLKIVLGASKVAQWYRICLPMRGDTGDSVSVPGLGRSAGGGNGNPLQYSCLGNPMDRGARKAIVHGLQRVGHDLACTQKLFKQKKLFLSKFFKM